MDLMRGEDNFGVLTRREKKSFALIEMRFTVTGQKLIQLNPSCGFHVCAYILAKLEIKCPPQALTASFHSVVALDLMSPVYGVWSMQLEWRRFHRSHW